LTFGGSSKQFQFGYYTNNQFLSLTLLEALSSGLATQKFTLNKARVKDNHMDEPHGSTIINCNGLEPLSTTVGYCPELSDALPLCHHPHSDSEFRLLS
jgi:hypothetical protein